MADRYTKAVLTVIACALTVIAAENIRFVGNAKAQSLGIQHVIVDRVSDEPVHVAVDSIDGYILNNIGPFHVQVDNFPNP